MVKILTFFSALVLLSYYLTNTALFFPLDLIRGFNTAIGYFFVIAGIGLTIWLMGD